MKTLSIDIETYSDQNLVKTGVYRYVESPVFEILLFAYSADGAPVRALYHFTPLKGLQLSDKEGAYTVSYRQTGSRTVEATIRANTLMKAVLFEARALQLNPSDGYFDLLPGQEKSVTLEFVEPIGAEGVDGAGIFVTALNGLLGLPSEQPVTKNVE